jgi:hypothetical protein
VDRATKLDIVRRKIANGTTPADQRRAVRAAPAATDAVLFTGGIGDAIAVESLLTPDERDRIKTFYYAAPAAKTVRALFQSIPGYPNLKTHTVLPTGSVTLYSKRDVEARVGHLPQGVVDLSIRSVFPGPRAYTGSSLLVEPLRTDLTGLVPAGDYVVVVPVSTWFAPRGRNFGSTDWNVCTGALRAAGLVGVVLCGERIPVPDDGTYVDLTGRTDILQSVELVKRAAGYIGIDSWASVVASKTARPGYINVKCRPHARQNRHRYFAPAATFEWLTDRTCAPTWGAPALPSGGGNGLIYVGCDRFDLVIEQLTHTRRMGCNWPAQVWFRDGDPVRAGDCEALNFDLVDAGATVAGFGGTVPDDRTSDIDLAVRYTTFDTVVAMDASVRAVRLPCRLSNQARGVGAVGWDEPRKYIVLADRTAKVPMVGARPDGYIGTPSVDQGTGTTTYSIGKHKTFERRT